MIRPIRIRRIQEMTIYVECDPDMDTSYNSPFARQLDHAAGGLASDEWDGADFYSGELDRIGDPVPDREEHVTMFRFVRGVLVPTAPCLEPPMWFAMDGGEWAVADGCACYRRDGPRPTLAVEWGTRALPATVATIYTPERDLTGWEPGTLACPDHSARRVVRLGDELFAEEYVANCGGLTARFGGVAVGFYRGDDLVAVVARVRSERGVFMADAATAAKEPSNG